MNEASYIPFHRPSIEKDDFEGVNAVLASGWLTTGAVAMDFERRFAEYVGCKHALAVNSATAALQLAMDAIGISAGDEVLVPTYTFTASAEVVTYLGGRPVLCDSEEGGFNLDVRDAERRITERTKAIIPVHLAGEPCNITAIRELASRYGLRVVEDAAHALPSSWAGQRIGSISDMTAFSFYATKTITTGEGGMLTTNNDEFAARASRMRLHGISSDAWKRYSKEGSWYYEVEHAGYKLNMPDLLASLGRTQLTKADRFLKQRQAIALRYNEAFSEVAELETPPKLSPEAEHSWHLYILRLRAGRLTIERGAFIEALKKEGVGAAVHYIPLHLHPYYRRTYGYAPGDFRQAEDAYARCLSLPIYPDMSADEVERVLGAVRKVVTENRAAAVAVA
jgi:dTDP-4-amino-4,6-dideoxygalactose transaminase